MQKEERWTSRRFEDVPESTKRCSISVNGALVYLYLYVHLNLYPQTRWRFGIYGNRIVERSVVPDDLFPMPDAHVWSIFGNGSAGHIQDMISHPDHPQKGFHVALARVLHRFKIMIV